MISAAASSSLGASLRIRRRSFPHPRSTWRSVLSYSSRTRSGSHRPDWCRWAGSAPWDLGSSSRWCTRVAACWATVRWILLLRWWPSSSAGNWAFGSGQSPDSWQSPSSRPRRWIAFHAQDLWQCGAFGRHSCLAARIVVLHWRNADHRGHLADHAIDGAVQRHFAADVLGQGVGHVIGQRIEGARVDLAAGQLLAGLACGWTGRRQSQRGSLLLALTTGRRLAQRVNGGHGVVVPAAGRAGGRGCADHGGAL